MSLSLLLTFGAVLVRSLPVVAVFASLLSQADPIFAKRLGDFVDLFNIQNLPEDIFRLVYILVIAYALAGIYLHAAAKSGEAMEEKTWVPPFLGFTEAAIVLASVLVLFAAFVIIQFQYFFGGQVNISIEGYTYSEYARKGFGELVAVAFFSLLLLLGLGAITRRETSTQRRIFSNLGVILVGLVIVLLLSAYRRLVLLWPNSKTGGGQYDDLCDVEGKIYLEVDLQVPVCISCGGSLDGYTGSSFSSATAVADAFTGTYKIYKNLEFEDKIGEVSFDLYVSNSFCN